MNTLELKKDIYWLGALDPDLRVFDIIMETEFGTTYNSYAVKGSSKLAIFETVKVKYFDLYLEKLKETIGDPKNIDYIVVNHTEPDHAGSVEKLLDIAPNAKVVGSSNAIEFLKEIANKEFDYIIVAQGDTIDLGNKTLKFIEAPFLHWPDSIYTYIPEDKLLVTCDSFGSHYSFDGILHSKIPTEKHDDYMSALLYYYTAIFGPFKNYVLEAIDKIKDFDIEMICTGHGPVLDDNPKEIIEIYKKWSTVENPNKYKKVIIPYVAAYGYTEELANKISEGIKSYDNSIEIKLYNINISNYGGLKGDILSDFLWADGILFGTSTINGDALPLIWDLTIALNPIVHGGKYVAAFGSYGWSGEGVPNITARLDQLRMNVLDGYNIKFKPSSSQLEGAFDYGKLFADLMVNGKMPVREDRDDDDISLEELNPTGEQKKWKCLVCGEVFDGVYPPNVCSACGVGQELFEMVEDETIDYQVATSRKFVIIGNGVAGLTAAESIRLRDSEAKIDIYTTEELNSYYRPIISDSMTENIKDEDFFLKPKAWYSEMKINVHLQSVVQSIDSDKKELHLLNGEVVEFDKLILSTGASAFVPPIANINLAGSFSIRTMKNVEIIKEYSKKCKRATVVGGGVLGLEIAWELKLLGHEVDIIETKPRIFPRQLDEEGSKLLEEAIIKAGVNVYKNRHVVSLEGEGHVTGLKLDNGQSLRSDLVVINAGITPNTELVKNKLTCNRGIVVNKMMETSHPDIYACGDCAEYDGSVVGLWEVATTQGKIAGAQAAGDTTKTYKEVIQPVNFSGMNLDVFSMGDIDGATGTTQVLTQVDKDNFCYKKLYFHNDMLVGGILIGDVAKASVILKGIRDDYPMPKVLKKLYK